jgi:hypothetical protein
MTECQLFQQFLVICHLDESFCSNGGAFVQLSYVDIITVSFKAVLTIVITRANFAL